MSEDRIRKEKLAALEARLAEKRTPNDTTKRHQDEHYSQAQMAWRLVIELVAGLAIGFGIGFGLDKVFGTLPWMMIVFTMLGFAAGIRTMLRSAKEMQETPKGDEMGD
ncbi:MAG: F0F1 ATP synthase subunit I [Silicimonas sp.]|nr:F0F1 ATP synthase subunit I [Silicimonas sp.]